MLSKHLIGLISAVEEPHLQEAGDQWTDRWFYERGQLNFTASIMQIIAQFY